MTCINWSRYDQSVFNKYSVDNAQPQGVDVNNNFQPTAQVQDAAPQYQEPAAQYEQPATTATTTHTPPLACLASRDVVSFGCSTEEQVRMSFASDA